MMKLFAAFRPSSRQHAEPSEDVRYTRFSCDKTREAQSQPADTARTAPSRRTRQPADQVLRPAQHHSATVVDANAQLHSEANIPVSVLHRALPGRFAKLS